ncbi:riboflavin synthase, partial [Maribacter sp.]
MFTGIIETLGKVTSLEAKGGNLDITIESSLTPELKIDQSVAHNGVCLTVVSLTDTTYTVTAIAETLNKTNLNTLKTNDLVNLERAMILGSRLDGHIVQGHVDQTGECTSVKEDNGSWIFSFTYDAAT